MAYGDRTRCRDCGAEIVQLGGGHRQRQYCNDTCKQRAYLQRKEHAYLAALRALWSAYLPATQDFLVTMTQLHSEEFARRFAAIIDAEKQQSSAVAGSDDRLLDLGERLHYCELRIKHPLGGHDVIIRAGRDNWQHFADVAEGRLIRAAAKAAWAIVSRQVIDEKLQ